MTTLSKALIAAAALLTVSGAAAAENTFEAKFSFTPTDSVETIYDQFETTAAKACKADASQTRSLSVRTKIESDCRKQLIDGAVEASNLLTLIAYHQEQTQPGQPTALQFAEQR